MAGDHKCSQWNMNALKTVTQHFTTAAVKFRHPNSWTAGFLLQTKWPRFDMHRNDAFTNQETYAKLSITYWKTNYLVHWWQKMVCYQETSTEFWSDMMREKSLERFNPKLFAIDLKWQLTAMQPRFQTGRWMDSQNDTMLAILLSNSNLQKISKYVQKYNRVNNALYWPTGVYISRVHAVQCKTLILKPERKSIWPNDPDSKTFQI